MAGLVINSNYAGGLVGTIVRNALLGNETISRNLVAVHEAPENQVNIRTFDVATAGFWQDYTPDFPINGGSEMNYTQSTITMNPFTVAQTFDPELLRAYWGAEALQGVLTKRSIPTDLQVSLLDYMAQKNGTLMTEAIWAGDTSLVGTYLNKFDGFVKVIRANGDVDFVASPAAVTNAATAYTMLTKIYNAIPADLLYSASRAGLKIFMGNVDWKFYQDYQITTQQYKGPAVDAEGVDSFLGVKVVRCTGIPSGFAFACISDQSMPDVSALHYGCDSLKAERSILVDFTSNLSNLIGFRTDFAAGVQITNANQIICHNYVA